MTPGIFIGAFVAFFALLFAGGFAADYAVSSYQCSSTAAAMETTSYFSFSTGCMVRVNGKLMPLRNVRAM